MRRLRSKTTTAVRFLWHAKHMIIHILLGLRVMSIVAGLTSSDVALRWVWIAIAGSVIPDLEHVIYVFTYGKKDSYALGIRAFLREKNLVQLATFIESTHKKNTNLAFHNFYTLAAVALAAWAAYLVGWISLAIFFGAALSHYVFDVLEDIILLGHVNPNWKRWGRGKRLIASAISTRR